MQGAACIYTEKPERAFSLFSFWETCRQSSGIGSNTTISQAQVVVNSLPTVKLPSSVCAGLIKGCSAQRRNFNSRERDWHFASFREMPDNCRAGEGTRCSHSTFCILPWDLEPVPRLQTHSPTTHHPSPQPHTGEEAAALPCSRSSGISSRCHIPPHILGPHLYSMCL